MSYIATVGEEQPPRRLSSIPTHMDFRPDFLRVGLMIDGKERNGVTWYNADAKVYRIRNGAHIYGAETIEPFWRYADSRQQRRALARWRLKHPSQTIDFKL